MPMIDDFNIRFHNEYSDLLKDINKWVCSPSESPALGTVTEWNIPDIETEAFAITIFPPGQEIVYLNPPVAGRVRNISFNSAIEGRILVGRMVIGLSMAARFANGSGDLKPYIYAALKQVQEQKGFSYHNISFGNYYCTFKRPGEENIYGRELENSASVELRFYSDSVNKQFLIDKGIING